MYIKGSFKALYGIIKDGRTCLKVKTERRNNPQNETDLPESQN